MAEQIAQTISNGDCEKGISQNGMAHLSGVEDYFQKNNFKFQRRDEYLNELVKIKLENLNLDKRIGFFMMEKWSEIRKTREDVLSAYKKGQRDFWGWNLSDADLRGAELRGVDLSLVDLTGANLQGADLRGANLEWAKLAGADLSEADLTGANLKFANFTGAVLRWADLSHADLRFADFTGTDLTGTNYNSKTLFPDNFNPENQGMVFCV